MLSYMVWLHIFHMGFIDCFSFRFFFYCSVSTRDLCLTYMLYMSIESSGMNEKYWLSPTQSKNLCYWAFIVCYIIYIVYVF